LNWFNSRDAVELGAALAEQFTSRAASGAVARSNSVGKKHQGEAALQELLRRADLEVRALGLNFYKRARFANSFKWRLLENGIEGGIADEVTKLLLLRLLPNKSSSEQGDRSEIASNHRARPNNHSADFFDRGNKCMAEGAYAQAITIYKDLILLDPLHAGGHNGLGSAYFNLGQYREAEDSFRQAIKIMPELPDAYANLGITLRLKGKFAESENALRLAVKLNPRRADVRINLGMSLTNLRRLREANAQFKKALKLAPRNPDALFGIAILSKAEGRFEESTAMIERALEVNPKMTSAWASLAGMRKMTSSDGAWLERAEQLAASDVPSLEEAELRFAIGKYCDDIQDYKRAFQSYKRANDLVKGAVPHYRRGERTRLVDGWIGVYTRECIAGRRASASTSAKPVFVVGMMRSGTSLVEQIIASHPAAKGAGELEYWVDAMREHGAAIQKGLLDDATGKRVAEAYLRALENRCGDALRIVDKLLVNSDYLGVIHSIFPNAQIIHVRRDPIDTCLSCYFQNFPLDLNFTLDLSDLAHFYREHHRLMTHWRAVLPPGTILEVPYEELVADQESWTRKILDFLGLEWSEKCLNFHATDRPVLTASAWQVRQKIFKSSVRRWHNYRDFIGPLLDLKELYFQGDST
jgi:tetratricopeptide (TPR) repeat protein